MLYRGGTVVFLLYPSNVRIISYGSIRELLHATVHFAFTVIVEFRVQVCSADLRDSGTPF